MKKNSITWTEIEDVIDDCIMNDKSFCFVVDGEMAEYLGDIIFDDFGIEDECEEIRFDEDEYYVSILPSDENEPCMLFIESAKGYSGEYKMVDLDNCKYYIFTDMPHEVAFEKLYGDSFGYFEIVEESDEENLDEDVCSECYCDECTGCDFNEDYEDDDECSCLDCTVEDYKQMILESDGCPDCVERILKDFVVDIASRFIEIEED